MASPTHSKKTPSVLEGTQRSLADVYAESLLDLCNDEQAAAIAKELSELVNLLDGVEGARKLFCESLLSVRQRRELIDRVFVGRVGDWCESILVVLARRNRLELLWDLPAAFERQLDRRRGKINVTVTTAKKISDAQRESLIAKLRSSFNAEPVLTEHVEEDLLGGTVLQVGETVYDASVRGQLQRMHQRLVEKATQ